MGRQASVSIEHVRTAVEALRAEGKNVSSRSVREKLGNVGSMGTINRLLQQCLSSKADERSSLRQLPSELQHAVLTYADQHAEEARAQIANELVHCRHEMADLTDDNERLTETIENLHGQVDTLVSNAATIQGRIAQLTSELETARQDAMMERQAAESARIELAKLQTRTEQLASLGDELREVKSQYELQRRDHAQSQQSVAILEIQKAALENQNQGLNNELTDVKHFSRVLSEKIEQLSGLLDQERIARVLAERELAVKTATHAERRPGNGERKKRTSDASPART